jgi:5-methylcytosine-specific restriction endonuclease McrA
MREYQRAGAACGTSWAAQNADRRRAQQAKERAGRRARTDAEILAARTRLRPGGTKRCVRCIADLPLSLYGEARQTPDGLRAVCKPCDAARSPRARLLVAALPEWEEGNLYQCGYCWAPFEHVDHILPRAKGGTDAPFNLYPACADCNLSKSDRDVAEWYAERFAR